MDEWNGKNIREPSFKQTSLTEWLLSAGHPYPPSLPQFPQPRSAQEYLGPRVIEKVEYFNVNLKNHCAW